MQTSRRIFALNFSTVQRSFLRNAYVNTALFAKKDAELKSWNEIPGPWKLPVIGQAHHFIPPGSLSDLVTLQDVIYKKFGPIVRFDAALGRPKMLFLFDPEAISLVLRAENLTPYRPTFMSLEYYRKKYNKPTEETRPTGLITEMKSIRNEKNKLQGDFMTEMNKWSLESVAVVALGGRLNCFDSNLSEDSPERRLIKCVHDTFQVSTDLDFRPSLWKYFATKTFKKGMNLYQEQEELAKHFINKSRKKMLANKKPDEEKGILEKLLEIDERVAIAMACDMLFAGVDTGATTIAATLYLLATNQEKQDKLRQEVTSGEDSRKYLKACVKESMRVLPVVSGTMRMATKEYVILGYRIPMGTFITTCHHYLSLMDSQFPRAKEYIPERWIEDGPLSYKSAQPFAYAPFGFGTRSCVGRRIAELAIETFLERVIQNFKVEWTGPPPAVKPSQLNYFIGPFGCIFKDL